MGPGDWEEVAGVQAFGRQILRTEQQTGYEVSWKDGVEDVCWAHGLPEWTDKMETGAGQKHKSRLSRLG